MTINEVMERDRYWIEERGVEARLKGAAIYLEDQWRPRWNGALPIYLVWCDDCESFTTIHPHGYKKLVFCTRCRGNAQSVMSWRERYQKMKAEIRGLRTILDRRRGQ